MDSWILDYLKDTLLNSETARDYVLGQPDSALSVLKRQVTSFLSGTLGTMAPVVTPILNRLTQALSSSPDIVVLGVAGLVVLFALQVMVWLRRAIAFWTRMAFRVAFYAGLVALAASVWQRGLEASWTDAVAIGGTLLKYGGWMKDTWVNEYRKYEEQGQQTGGSGYSRAQAGGWRNR